MLILAGCGGGGTPQTRVVQGDGFTFEAPAGWTTTGARAEHGEDVVEVRVFPLMHAYDPSSFNRVKPEIERAARELQQQLHASLDEREVTAGGGRALQFDLVHGGVLEQVTFVLRGKTEYQLYCRRAKDGDAKPCERLVATFRLR